MKKAYCIHANKNWKEKIDSAILDATLNNLNFVDVYTYINSTESSNVALLTIDDGYEQRYSELPEYLRLNDIKALSFLIIMNENMNKLLIDWKFWIDNKDVFDIGSHSLTHSKVITEAGNEEVGINRILKRKMNAGKNFKHGLLNKEFNYITNQLETDIEFEQRVLSELILSKQIIERYTNKECIFFAYPWGEYNDNLIRLIKSVNYKYAFTVNKGSIDDNYKLNRRVIEVN